MVAEVVVEEGNSVDVGVEVGVIVVVGAVVVERFINHQSVQIEGVSAGS